MNQQTLINLLEKVLPRWSPTMYKLTLGSLVVLAIAAPLVTVGIPFIEFFNGMAAQPKGKTQGTYGRVFGEHLIVERPPVEGTLPRDYVPYPFDALGNTIEDAKKAGEQFPNPLPVNMEVLQRGRELYEIYCVVCHGKQGQGDGSVVGADRYPAPPSLHTKQAVEYKDGTVFHVITQGVGKMPSYADLLEPHERWTVVHYLRALQRSQSPKPEDLKQ